MKILGVSYYYHDSAAALVWDGDIRAAAQEERFTRKKNDEDFPQHAIEYCLKEAGIKVHDLDAVVFYDKPLLKFERILETYLYTAPFGFFSFVKAMSVWVKKKLWIGAEIRKRLNYCGKIYYSEHHLSHAASAFFPSPFQDAVILTADGVGEWVTTTIAKGSGNRIELLKQIRFPHSLGLLYSAFTHYTGFKINSGEYKMMGLAPYGSGKYTQKILDHIIDLKEDGSFCLNMDYFNYLSGLTMTNAKFHKLFEGLPRKPESLLTQRDMDLAKSIQEVTEIVMEKMVVYAMKITGLNKVCLAGGVALNCVANGKLLKKLPIQNIFIQPAAGDAGSALGAALLLWYHVQGNPRTTDEIHDSQKGSFLGPHYDAASIEKMLCEEKIPFTHLKDEDIFDTLAKLLDQQAVIGVLQGRMEFGPRSLGARSILGDARSPSMQKRMNLKIKYRESFRPFAPICLEEDLQTWFDCRIKNSYMLLVVDILEKQRISMTEAQNKLFGIEQLDIPRSPLPAITHVDYSARIQSVSEKENPFCHRLLKAFKALTGVGALVNTSFNVRDEPIVNTPQEALICFKRTDMDYLLLENCLIKKVTNKVTSNVGNG